MPMHIKLRLKVILWLVLITVFSDLLSIVFFSGSPIATGVIASAITGSVILVSYIRTNHLLYGVVEGGEQVVRLTPNSKHTPKDKISALATMVKLGHKRIDLIGYTLYKMRLPELGRLFIINKSK